MDDLDMRAVDRSELWDAEVVEFPASAAPANVSSFVRYDLIALARQRDYQAEVERASALLCKLQPDMIAGETLAIRETEQRRSNWPFIAALGASLLFWLTIAWCITSLA
jgi:hypothetical protein